jgi:hypothetical protein
MIVRGMLESMATRLACLIMPCQCHDQSVQQATTAMGTVSATSHISAGAATVGSKAAYTAPSCSRPHNHAVSPDCQNDTVTPVQSCTEAAAAVQLQPAAANKARHGLLIARWPANTKHGWLGLSS